MIAGGGVGVGEDGGGAGGTGGAGRADQTLRASRTSRTNETLNALRAGCTSRAGRTGRTGGTRHASRAGRTGRASRTGGAGGTGNGGQIGGAELAGGGDDDEGAASQIRAINPRHVGRGLEALGAEIDLVGFNATAIPWIAKVDVVVTGGQVVTGLIAKGEVVVAVGIPQRVGTGGGVIRAGQVG